MKKLKNDQHDTQIQVQIKPSPNSLRKIKCTHCKKLYVYVKVADVM